MSELHKLVSCLLSNHQTPNKTKHIPSHVVPIKPLLHPHLYPPSGCSTDGNISIHSAPFEHGFVKQCTFSRMRQESDI